MNRERITITLRDDMLKRVDEMIDGIKVRNRSHAIEIILARILSKKVTKAFILAGGKGTRMRPFTYEMPKPMIPVQGRPLLEHIIDLLRKYDVRDVIISLGYLGDRIQEYFGNGSKFGVKITYVKEDNGLGTAGPLNLAKNLLNEPFLMLNGDVLMDIDLDDFIEFHYKNHGLCTIALTAVEDPSRFGVARLRGEQILEFIEKPRKGTESSNLINAGVYLLEPEVLNYIPKGRTMMETDVFPKLAKENQLFGYPFDGQWLDTGTYEAYERAIKTWKGVH